MSKSRLSHRGMIALACVVVLPSIVGRVAVAVDPPFHAKEVGHWDGYGGTYCDIWADGRFVYLPNWRLGDGQNARVHVVDIRDPTNPTLARTFFLPSPNEFASPQDVKIGDGLMFIALEGDSNDSAAIVDVRNPRVTSFLTTVRISGFRNIHNVFYDNGFLYLADSGTSRVGIVDLTAFDPDNPPASPITSPKWMLTNVGSSFVHDITVKNGRLYAAAWNSGLRIYDVSDVANSMPTLIGSVGGNHTHSMWPTDDGKFVVTGEERTGGGIKVYEIIDNGGSLTLALRDSLAYPSSEAFSVHNQMIIGYRLYNSWYEKGLQVFDIDPVDGTLSLFATFDTSDFGLGNWGVYPFLGDDMILLSDGSEGLYIVDIAVITVDPPSPATAPFDRLKNRYLSFSPTNPDLSVAYRVDLTESNQFPDALGTLGWVGEPDADDLAPVVADPFFSDVWPAVVHINGCEIVPVSTYELRAVTDTGDVTSPLVVRTMFEPLTKKWADCVGSFDGMEWSPPQGILNFEDVTAAIKTFIDSQAFNATHVSITDVQPQTPNHVVNFNDVFTIVLAFQGAPYPFGCPDDPCRDNLANPCP